MSDLEDTKKLIEMYEKRGLDKRKPEEYETLKEQYQALLVSNSSTEASRSIHKEAEFVLHTLSVPDIARNVTCPECDGFFQTNYVYQLYCSFSCLKEAVERKGLIWDPNKPAAERWRGEPPSVIKPSTLRSLLPWAYAIIKAMEGKENEERQAVRPESDTVDHQTSGQESGVSDNDLHLDFDFLSDFSDNLL